MDSLAIIIPVYKKSFLVETLESIANQTNKNFNLYICNDNSPYDIDEIVDDFKKKYNLSLEYIKFKENLGGKDLVAHWERCVEQTKDESLIWLFSDDDVLEPDCVESLFETVNRVPYVDVFRFNLSIINGKSNIIKHCRNYPDMLSSEDFFALLYSGKIDARMPEFVFRRKRYDESGGYVSFDLAWRSDNATVIRMSALNGIMTIPKSRVLWRISDDNISAKNNLDLRRRKDLSTISFFNWIDSYFKLIGASYKLSTFRLELAYSVSLLETKETYSLVKLFKLSNSYIYNINNYRKFLFVLATYYNCLRNFKNKILKSNR